MRNWAIAGIAMSFLAGSAWSNTLANYKGVEEVCLFSSMVPPADSKLAIQTVGIGAFHAPELGHDSIGDSETGFSSPARGNSGEMANSTDGAAVISLRNYELLWRARSSDGDVGPRASAPNYDFYRDRQHADGNTMPFQSRFKVSGVPGSGVERNGFVAGFDFKY